MHAWVLNVMCSCSGVRVRVNIDGYDHQPHTHTHLRTPPTGLVSMLRVTSDWQQKLQGLCGTLDGNSVNDMMTPDGSIASSPAEFGNSWKEAGVTCSDVPDVSVPTDPCDVRIS